MGKALNILLGSVATAMVSVGVAAQTGTVHWPTFSESAPAGGVHAQQAIMSPRAEPTPTPSPSPTQAPAPPPAQAAPPPHKKHGG